MGGFARALLERRQELGRSGTALRAWLRENIEDEQDAKALLGVLKNLRKDDDDTDDDDDDDDDDKD